MSFFSSFSNQKLNSRVFNASTTWSPSQSGIFTVYVVGAGGSGGVIEWASGKRASGGGGGGCAIKTLQLSSSTTYTLTIGAGGARVGNASGTTTSLSGNAGGASSFSGSGITTITGNGGGGGNYSGATATGGTGGTATGGDYNFSGQTARSCTTDNAPTGGGAAGIFGPLATPANTSVPTNSMRGGTVSWNGTGGGQSTQNRRVEFGSGISIVYNTLYPVAPSGDWFCGGNGAYIYTNDTGGTLIAYSGSGGFGGGAGGIVYNTNTGAQPIAVYTGTGGGGVIIIEGVIL